MPRRNRNTIPRRFLPPARPERAPTRAPKIDTDHLARELVQHGHASIHILEPTKGPYRSENR